MPASASESSTKDEKYLNTLSTAIQAQINDKREKQSPSEHEHDGAAQNLPAVSLLVGMESYASIELGVANVEIMYQDNLKCIAMTSDGWRCPTVIPEEQLLKSRELLCSSATHGSELDIELLPRLVLCPGHAAGDLPRLCSEKWAVFSEQRSPKEEAMSKFNANFWKSVQFFSNDKRNDLDFQISSLNRPRSTSNQSSRSGCEYDFGSTQHAEGNSPTPLARTPLDSQTFGVSLSHSSFKPMSSRETFTERACSAGDPTDSSITERQAESVPALMFMKLRPMDARSRSETVATSATIEAIKEMTLQKKSPVPQDSQPKMSTQLPSFQEAIQKTHRSQDTVDKGLIKEMNSPCLLGGYVHILKSPDGKLCKIGKATDIHILKQQVQAKCQLKDFHELHVVAIRTKHPERATKLVHLELQNFRAVLSCENDHQPTFNNEAIQSEHGEWFDVIEQVAIRLVSLWCDFTCRAYTFDGTMKAEWATRLASLPKPDPAEILLQEKFLGGGNVPNISLHHDKRLSRYEKWLRDGSG